MAKELMTTFLLSIKISQKTYHKKIKIGKPLEQIAEEFEETIDAIKELYQRIKDEIENKVHF